MKKRLFITTGSISLINALVIIEQLKYTESTDELAVLSFSLSQGFIEITRKIAGLHNFKTVKFYKREKDLIKDIDFNCYDEVYSVLFNKFYKKFNKHKCAFIFEEGPGSAKANLTKLDNIKGFYYTPYLNKFSFIGINNEIAQIEISKDIFINISSKIIELLKEKEQLETNKNLLFIGHYIHRQLGDDAALDFYCKYIEYFMQKGYTVYFKGHPRDNDVILPKLENFYKNNPKFQILNNRLPIEIYNYNFDMAAGAYSGTLVTLPHYRNIPAINLPLKDLYYSPAGLGFKQFFALYDAYCPGFEQMESVLGRSKQEIQKYYWALLDKKVKLVENNPLQEILFYKTNLFKDIFYGFCGIFCNQANKTKLKNFARRDFYSKVERFLERN